MSISQDRMPGSTFGEVLGARLRELREATVPKLSQDKVARTLEMTKETVRRIEHGEGTTVATVQEYLDAIGASWEDVLIPPQGPAPDDGSGYAPGSTIPGYLNPRVVLVPAA